MGKLSDQEYVAISGLVIGLYNHYNSLEAKNDAQSVLPLATGP